MEVVQEELMDHVHAIAQLDSVVSIVASLRAASLVLMENPVFMVQ